MIVRFHIDLQTYSVVETCETIDKEPFERLILMLKREKQKRLIFLCS